MEDIDRKAVERSVAARLVSSGKLDEAALDRVLRVQANNDERLEALLIKLGLASERDVAEALSRELDLVIAEAADYPEAPVLDGKLAGKFLRHSGILPLADGGDGLIVAMVDPLNFYVARAVEMASGRRVVRRIALPTDFEAAYARLYEAEKALPGHVADSRGDLGADEELLEDVDRLRDLASTACCARRHRRRPACARPSSRASRSWPS
jgi:general secretion pathway protein E